ncbi:hypothetical protein BGX33_010275 [Mortierella sp. NVP41]|nr:hypothetical protein BGX33_010275 [Mortierella sp. NVP41]
MGKAPSHLLIEYGVAVHSPDLRVREFLSVCWEKATQLTLVLKRLSLCKCQNVGRGVVLWVNPVDVDNLAFQVEMVDEREMVEGRWRAGDHGLSGGGGGGGIESRSH